MGSGGREGIGGRGAAARAATVAARDGAPSTRSTTVAVAVAAAAIGGFPTLQTAAAGGCRERWTAAASGGARHRRWRASPLASRGKEPSPRGRGRPTRRTAAVTAAAMGLAAAAAALVFAIALASGGAAASGGGRSGGSSRRTPRNGVTPWVWEHPLTGGVVSTSVMGCHVGRDGSLLVVGTATSAGGTVSATVTKLAAATGAVLDTATLPGLGVTPTTVVASAYDADADLLLLTGLASGGVPPPPLSGRPAGAPAHVTTADGGGGVDVYVAAWSTLGPTAAAASTGAHLVRRFTVTLGGAGNDEALGVAALGGGRYAVVGSARRAAGAGPPDGLLVGVLSSAGRVVTSAVTRLGGGAGYMAAARAVAVSPADGTILVAYEEVELPVGGGEGTADAAAADSSTSSAMIFGGVGGMAAGDGASQRFSIALFSAATASLVRAPSPLTYRFSPFTPAAAVEPVTAAYSPAAGAYYVVCRNVALANTRLPPPAYSINSGVSYTLATLPAAAPSVVGGAGGGTAAGGGDALATRLLTVSFPDPATRAGAAELSPTATVFLDVASSASTLQLALAVSSSVVPATLTTIRYDYSLTAGSRATLAAGGRPGVAAIFRGAAAPSARLPTFAYGAVHATSATAPNSTAAAGGGGGGAVCATGPFPSVLATVGPAVWATGPCICAPPPAVPPPPQWEGGGRRVGGEGEWARRARAPGIKRRGWGGGRGGVGVGGGVPHTPTTTAGRGHR